MGICTSKDESETDNGDNGQYQKGSPNSLDDVKETSLDHGKIVIALDIGTENMGYAFSCHTRKNKIYTAKHSSSQNRERMPNALLLSHHSRNSVGFDAVRRHSNLLLKPLHSEQLYFRNFRKRSIERETVDSEYHITVSEEEIIYHLIEALRQNALETAHEILCCEREHLEKNVEWVLTTPNFKKQDVVLLGAARKAKLKNIKIVPESKAAAWYCLCTPLRMTAENSIIKLGNGHNFAVVNLGAGKTSICVYEVQSDITLKLHNHESSPVGGNSVNDKFENFMEYICGSSSWKKFKIDHEYDYEHLMRSFVDEKVKFDGNTDSIVITLPQNLLGIIETKEIVTLAIKIESKQDLLDRAELMEDKLFIYRKQIEDYFAPSYQTIRNMLEKIRGQRALDLNAIVFIGGYSASMFIMTKLKQECQSFDIAFPQYPDMVVLKGAVMLGLARNLS